MTEAKKIEEYTDAELKVIGFDTAAELELLNHQMKAVVGELARRKTEREKAAAAVSEVEVVK